MFKDAHQGELSHELDQLDQPTNREKPRGNRTPDARSLQEHAHPSSSSTDSDSSSETSLPGTDITRRTSSATVRSDKNRSAIARLWREHVNVAVDHKACRDHLALERTYLAYLRTSVMLANVGVLVAQLFALQQSDEGFGYSTIGKPMASVCFSAAIVTILLGTARAWRFRKALIDGKALSGGWEMMSIAVGFLVITGLFFGFLVAIDVVKSSKAPVSS